MTESYGKMCYGVTEISFLFGITVSSGVHSNQQKVDFSKGQVKFWSGLAKKSMEFPKENCE